MNMRNWLVTLFVAMVAMGTFGSSAGAQTATPVAGATVDLDAAVSWLMDQQAEGGAFLGFSGEPDAGTTIDAVLALVAAGHGDSDAVTSAMNWLGDGDTADAFAATGPGQAAKLALAQLATGGDPTSIGGIDPMERATAQYDEGTGLYSESIFEHALVMMAITGSGDTVPESAINAIADTQAPEGGWAFDGATDEGVADTNTTAMVIQALVAAGEGESDVAQAGLDYLHTSTDEGRGASYQPGADFPTDSSSTAMVIQAVLAMGEDPASDEWGDLPSALGSFQNESGAFHFNADDTSDNAFSTVQAIPAAAGATFPILTESEAVLNDSWLDAA